MRRKPAGIPEPADGEPRESDPEAFARLFEDAYRRCFSTGFTAPLSESESHHFSVDIEESTGLEIGWKSLKNYSGFLLGRTRRVENPSVPTLDTLARYVAGAPRIDEARRRTQERHYPYWFRYREGLRQAESGRPLAKTPEAEALQPVVPEPVVPEAAVPEPVVAEPDASEPRPAPARRRSRRPIVLAAAAVALASLLALLIVAVRGGDDAGSLSISDDFDDVSTQALAARGWSVQSVDSAHWARRAARPGHLTLFTLAGDNWPQPGQSPVIRNLLVRRSPPDCFVADVRLTSFFPRRNWQQAGLLLLEDTAFVGRSARLSIAFNDFSGGFPQTKEVIVQAITSLGVQSVKPEEVVHRRLFVDEPATERLVRQNLESAALRIEKRGTHLRLLYSAGPATNAPFREVGRSDFDFRPRYVAVFALKGFVTGSGDAPAHLDAFSLSPLPCPP